MYQGKFDKKRSGADLQEILAQRNAEASAPQASSRRPESRAMPQNPPRQNPQRPASPRQPAPQRPNPNTPRTTTAQSQNVRRSAPAAPQKQAPRLGSTIFYTLYFLFILVFFVATLGMLIWLNGWLIDYQAAQPSAKAQAVFDQIFTNPNWADIYAAAGAQDTQYEGKEAFAQYMNEYVGGQELNFLETSAGLSGDKIYVIRLGEEKIATFTLTDNNHVGDVGLGNITQLPDWQLSAVDVVLNRDNTYRIVRLNSHRTMINGVELGDDHTIMKAGTNAADYLPAGVEDVAMCTQEITGLFVQPDVQIFDDKGNQMEVTYDEATKTFTEKTTANTMSDDQASALRMATETYCLWMIAEVSDRGTAAKYFDPAGDAYSFTSISKDQLWMQSNNGHEFKDYTVTNFTQYSDSIFSARVDMKLAVTRTDGSVKDYPYGKTMFFRKSDTGKWLCYNFTNEDTSKPVGKIRLTFMDGDNLLYTDFFTTDAKTLQTPTISNIPEGKVFAGWYTLAEEDGKTVYKVMFQPDESGLVTMADGATLEPMVLYPLFEDAGAVQETPAEAPTEAPSETSADTTEGAA